MKATLSVKGFALPFTKSHRYWPIVCVFYLMFITIADAAFSQTSR